MSYQKYCDVCGRALGIGAPCHSLLTNEQVDVCLECCSPALMEAYVDKLRARALKSDAILSRPPTDPSKGRLTDG